MESQSLILSRFRNNLRRLKRRKWVNFSQRKIRNWRGNKTQSKSCWWKSPTKGSRPWAFQLNHSLSTIRSNLLGAKLKVHFNLNLAWTNQKWAKMRISDLFSKRSIISINDVLFIELMIKFLPSIPTVIYILSIINSLSLIINKLSNEFPSLFCRAKINFMNNYFNLIPFIGLNSR